MTRKWTGTCWGLEQLESRILLANDLGHHLQPFQDDLVNQPTAADSAPSQTGPLPTQTYDNRAGEAIEDAAAAVNFVPVITLVGRAELALEALRRATYIDPGVTAWDVEDGDVTADIVVSGDVVVRSQPGNYQIHYNVVDSHGNQAAKVTRQVAIRDTLPPVITLSLDGQVIHVSDNTAKGLGGEANTDPKQPSASNNSSIGNAQRLATSIQRSTDLTQPDGSPVGSRQDWTATAAAGSQTVELPTATAWDRQDSSVEVTTTIVLVDLDGHPQNTIVEQIDFNQRSTYLLQYDAQDDSGNHAEQVVFALILNDLEAPSLTVAGGEAETIEAASDWTLLESTAIDNIDGNVTTEILYSITHATTGDKLGTNLAYANAASLLDTSIIGDYLITIMVSDAAGIYGHQNSNNTVTHMKAVSIRDTRQPSITLEGDANTNLEATHASNYVDAGAACHDLVDGVLSHAVEVSGHVVNMSQPGTYTIQYDCADLSNNQADTMTRTVIVQDTLPPVITLVGDANMTLPASPTDEYTDAGATCNDALDGPLSHAVEVSGHVVNMRQPGTYTIQYDCADLANNQASPVTRTVTVQDTLPPVITTLEDVILAEDGVVHMNGLNLPDHVSDQIYAASDIEFRIANFPEIPTGFGLTIGMDSESGNFTDRLDNTIHVHPANDFNGSTTVMIQARDPAGNVSQTKSFTLMVSPANDAPVAVPDSLTVAQGETTTLLDSGAASVLDNDTDDGDSGLAPVLDANQIDWHSFHNLTPNQFASDVDLRKDANFLIDIEIDQIDGQKFLSGVWQHNPDARLWAEYHDLTELQFYQLWSQYQESGYRLIDQESYLLGNQRYYAGIWLENPEAYAWISHLNSTSAQFSESFEQYKHNYLPSDLDAYTVDGATRYAHLWVENTELLNWILRRDMTTATFAYYTSKYVRSYRVHDVESYQVNGQQRYAAIWIENRNGRSWQHERDLNMNSYQNHWRHYRDLGYRLTDFEKHETSEGVRYAGVWRQNTTRPDWHLRSSIDATATDHLAEHDIPGMSVAIVQQGEIKYMRGFGHQDVAGDQWYSAQTINRLASVSKAIGGVLLLKLADQGQLDPAALTSMYVPQMPGHHTHTLAELTSNRGGVGHYSQLGLGTLYNQYDTATEASALFWNKDLVSSPGSSYFYSTHGYTLLGAGIEGATGQAIDDVLYNELGSGLGLTSLKAEDRSVDNEFRTKLYNTNNTEALADNISWKLLGGGVEASAYDLARFSAMLIGGDILSNESLQQLWTVPEPDNVSYAMGWTVGTQQGEFSIRKDGSQLGANTYLRLFPDLDLGIVVLSNRRYSEPGTLSYNIANAILNSDDPDPSDIVPEEPSLTASLVTDVTHGNLVFNSAGTFSYTHDGSETTQDSFTYQAHDGLLDSNIVTVTITIESDIPLPVTITGTKYDDLNGNGQRDANEPGLAGWTILLSDANGNPLANTLTDTVGNYSFSNLGPGTLVLSEQQQAGWVQTAPASPGTFTFVTSSGQNMNGLDFGNQANHPPVITSNGGGATAILITPENRTDLTTVTSTDADSDDTHNYSLSGGTDQGLFVIDTATGLLSFKHAPLFTTPADANTDNRYEVQVTVTDSGGLTDNQAITIIVTPHPKSAVWDGDGAVGNVGDGESWSDPNNWSWTEGDINDVAPNVEAPGDDVIFKTSPSVGTIDLQASRTVNSLSLAADYTLENHTLTITSGLVTVGGAEVTASIVSDILSPAGITKTGPGTLAIIATAPAVEIAAGTFILGSGATTNDLTVGSGTLAILNGSVIGDVINNGTLRVIGTAASLPLDTGSSTSAADQDLSEALSTWASGFVIVVPVAHLRNAAMPDDRERSNIDNHLVLLSPLLAANEPPAGQLSTGTTQERQPHTLYSFSEHEEKTQKELELIDQAFHSGWDQLG